VTPATAPAAPGRRPKVEPVPAASLVEDFGLYPRHDVDGSHVADLARALRAGVTLPPVVADRASKRLVDGWHRRRATIRVHGPEAPIRVEFRDYADEAAAFADAVALNSSHGRRLDRQDQVRVAVLAERLGMDAAQIGVLLHIEPGRVLELRPRVVFEEGSDLPVPAKPVAEDFYGQELTPAQLQAMKSFSGNRVSQQVTQLLQAVASGLINQEDGRLCRRLHELAAAILEHVPKPAEPAE
jgi:hypothetical protein